MMGLVARATIAAALLLTWSLPLARLAELPQQRAEAWAADAICRARGLPAVAFPLGPPLGAPSSASYLPGVSEMAQLFEPATARRWNVELAQVVLAAAAAVLLVFNWRFAPPLVIAAAILYLLTYDVRWDGYRLLAVTQSPRLWWTAVSQWSLSLWSQRLGAPLAVWVSLVGACLLLLRSATTARRATPAGASVGRWHRRWPFVSFNH
jgi:hypothetical protein